MKCIISAFAVFTLCFSIGVAQNSSTSSTTVSPVKEQNLVLVEGGEFEMGAKESDEDTRPVHSVKVASFQMSKYEVTVAEYRAFCQATGHTMPAPPAWGWRDSHPMVNVTWWDACSYCLWLSRVSGKKFRLPTEAEWEYAAKGGKKSQKFQYCGANNANEVAWNMANAVEASTQGIGQLKANELGLYDMGGNAWEWCSDYFSSEYYANSPSENPKGPEKGLLHVIRGGSWFDGSTQSTPYFRRNGSPADLIGNMGFRVVCEL
ncbi:MAG: formylglycine-generating enzyme family protein [Bacteroidia bacterium]